MSYAKNESTYNDNYDNSSTLGMNISRGWGGNASYITKTNYWLGSDGKTVLNDDQNKQLGTNVTGIASKVYMTGNLDFGSEVVTPANNTDTFIYDAQVDQQAEYYYLTAYDVLMKFDPKRHAPRNLHGGWCGEARLQDEPERGCGQLERRYPHQPVGQWLQRMGYHQAADAKAMS